MKNVTLKDVARISGVSVPTVSRVLNGGGHVSEETRRRIHEAADQLDFRPNVLAQSFALGRSFTVGVLAQKASGNFSTPVITGIIDELSKRDIAVLVYDDEDDPRARPQNLRTLQARKVDGIIVVGDGTDTPFPSISSLFQVPVVHAFGVSDGAEDTCLLPDDRQAGRLAAEHLLQQGRERIAHVTAMPHSRAVQDRSSGFSDSLEDAGHELVIPPLHGDWTTRWGFQAGVELAAKAEEFDAIFCANDYIAIGVARALERRGIRVPDDVALVGYDNWSKYSGSPDRFLTSVDPHLEVLGRSAATTLLATSREAGVVLQACELVPGVSSGALSPEGWDWAAPR
ncbi:Ribose operon repressor [Microbacterium oxydans]|uniref:Ribose operon repressor n=1 Tax=Microbacterium oxydans TaxID=82380 RepID=A0A0F0L145_9MICO|nr:LacI family DNA-binding transcriptional regulator [Microbacterium oxydans]KJL26838.1 Ribose operon repressor [Microbacterium oxydans]